MLHFEYYPQIEYSLHTAVNIMLRAKIREKVLSKTTVFYKYKIPDGDRPDTISTKYYGNPNFTWAIFYANNIFNPILEWPLGIQDFEKMVRTKYGSISSSQGMDNPHHYLLDDKYVIDRDTYFDGDIDFNRKKIVTNYDYEFELNEKKRNIKILDKSYLRQITNEIERVFK